MEFTKTAKEAHMLNQRLTGLYEDIGHVLNRYYEIDEVVEDEIREQSDSSDIGSGNNKVDVADGSDEEDPEAIKEDKGDMDNDGKDEPDDEEYMDNKDKAIKKAIKNESVRKTTVKEVKKWFKTLEENRYKRTYGSDARRVSWMVNNNLSEDYEAMPISMQKKWPKAAYKRERFLAKEFVKHLQGETKLRESIRRIIKKQLRG